VRWTSEWARPGMKPDDQEVLHLGPTFDILNLIACITHVSLLPNRRVGQFPSRLRFPGTASITQCYRAGPKAIERKQHWVKMWSRAVICFDITNQ